MADVFDFYVRDNRKITFDIAEPIMREDSGVTDFRFHIPKTINGLDMSDWAWWLVFVNAKKEKYSIALTLSDDPERPMEFNTATYTVDYAMSIKAGSVQFALEAINTGTGGAIDNEWHTLTYETKVKETLQGNQAEYAETESDIISELLIEVRNKVNQLVGGATPEVKDSIAEMTDHKKIYVLSTDGNWYRYNGTTWVSGGQYASGIVIDSTLSQSGQAADAKKVGDALATKVAKPLTSPNGTNGQLLRTLGNGLTEWVSYGLPTDAQTASAITAWLNDHPEATTTVQDGSITSSKIAIGALDYVTPETFGAVGDGVTDDTQAWNDAIEYAEQNNVDIICRSERYLFSSRPNIDGHDITVDGNGASFYFGTSGGFIISEDSYNIKFLNMKAYCTFEVGSSNPSISHFGINSSSASAEFLAHDITFENVSMDGGTFGIAANSAKNVTIKNCNFANFVYKPSDKAGGYGILLQSSIDVLIENCHFDSGAYGRHDIYVSVDRIKTSNIQCKRVTVSNCSFDHSNLVLDSSGHFYSSNTPAFMIRSCQNLAIKNCFMHSVTGGMYMYSGDGDIEQVYINNIIIDTPVYNTGTYETRSCVTINSDTEYQISATIENVIVKNIPSAYTQFAEIKKSKVSISNCNIGALRCLVYNGSYIDFYNIITAISEYFVRFYGTVKGHIRNIVFTSAISAKYNIASGAVVDETMFDDPYFPAIKYTTGSTVLNDVITNIPAYTIYTRKVNFGNVHDDLGGTNGLLTGAVESAGYGWQEFRSSTKRKYRTQRNGTWSAWADL